MKPQKRGTGGQTMATLIDADEMIKGICFIIEDSKELLTSSVVRKAMLGLVDRIKTVGGWISVEDRLPETRHAVLAYTPHYKNIWAVSMHEDRNWYIWSPGGRILLDPDWYGPITHWMPLPEPPKEEDDVEK